MRRDWELAQDIRDSILRSAITDFDQRRRGDQEKTKRTRVSSEAHPLTTKRGTPDPLADEHLKLGTSPDHPLEPATLPRLVSQRSKAVELAPPIKPKIFHRV